MSEFTEKQRKNREISNANLKPFQPGQSGNPKGRPKDPGITAGQLKKLDEVCPFDAKGRTWRKYLEERGLLQASQSPKAMGDFKDRIEGPITQRIGGDVENPIYYINVPSEQGKKDIERVMKGERT